MSVSSTSSLRLSRLSDRLQRQLGTYAHLFVLALLLLHVVFTQQESYYHISAFIVHPCTIFIFVEVKYVPTFQFTCIVSHQDSMCRTLLPENIVAPFVTISTPPLNFLKK